MADEFEELGNELNQEAWEWLDLYHPRIARTIMKYVKMGKTPDDIRGYVRERVGVHRDEFALRCANAARYLGSLPR